MFYFENMFLLWSCRELSRPGLASDRMWINHGKIFLFLKNCWSPIAFISVCYWGLVWHPDIPAEMQHVGGERSMTNSEVWSCTGRRGRFFAKDLHLGRILLPLTPPPPPHTRWERFNQNILRQGGISNCNPAKNKDNFNCHDSSPQNHLGYLEARFSTFCFPFCEQNMIWITNFSEVHT